MTTAAHTPATNNRPQAAPREEERAFVRGYNALIARLDQALGPLAKASKVVFGRYGCMPADLEDLGILSYSSS
jgi:hypothetical protein